MTHSDAADDLGAGVLFAACEKVGAALVARGYIRFLDRLYLPCSLSELTQEQILVVNRFRERSILVDSQFCHWRKIRGVFGLLIDAAKSKSVLEIGCGKFPLCQDYPVAQYLGVDIDSDAIAHNLGRDIPVVGTWDVGGIAGRYDACISIYAMHFHVDPTILEALANLLTPDAIVAFNVIGDSAYDAIAAAASWSSLGYSARIWIGGSLARKEILFLMARELGLKRRDAVAAAITPALHDGICRHVPDEVSCG